MQVAEPNNIKIYSITSASKSAIPDWLVEKNKKKLKYDEGWRNRIELLQDFQFPEASIKLRQTRDGQFLIGTGVYKPQVRVWELSQMAMKFERHTEAENVTFEVLSDDWTKSVHLQTDRSVEFHTQNGMHYRTRVPKVFQLTQFGRDLSYHYPSCDLVVVGASNDAWRLNLEQGRFMSPFETSMEEINVCGINPAHQLLGFGGIEGKMEFWDHRARKRVGVLDVAHSVLQHVDASLIESVPQCTSLAFDSDGLTFTVGTLTGQVVMYDLRRPTPLLVKDHQYGYPIKNLQFHTSGKVLSTDTKICKIWDKNTGDIFTSIEGVKDINDVCVFGGDSGLLMMTNEGVQIQSYYIPALGPAPTWCPFLDNLTEELEENPADVTTYDDYKFITKKELVNLNLEHLIGTNVLKAYMHGFFVDLRLYEKAKAIANPFEFEEHKKQMVQKKLKEKQASRISAMRKLPKVNKTLAAKLIEDDDSEEEGRKKKRSKASTSGETLLEDGRFAALFKDEDFQVDEASHEFRIHNPSQNTARKAMDRFEKVQDVGDMSDPEGHASDTSDSDADSDGDDAKKQASRNAQNAQSSRRDQGKSTVYNSEQQKLKFMQLKDGYSALKDAGQLYDQEESFMSRLQKQKTTSTNRVETSVGGNKTLSYVAQGKKKREWSARDSARGSTKDYRNNSAEQGDQKPKQAKKRGVRELGLARIGNKKRY